MSNPLRKRPGKTFTFPGVYEMDPQTQQPRQPLRLQTFVRSNEYITERAPVPVTSESLGQKSADILAFASLQAGESKDAAWVALIRKYSLKSVHKKARELMKRGLLSSSPVDGATLETPPMRG